MKIAKKKANNQFRRKVRQRKEKIDETKVCRRDDKTTPVFPDPKNAPFCYDWT